MKKLIIIGFCIFITNIVFAQNFSINATYPFKPDSGIDLMIISDSKIQLVFDEFLGKDKKTINYSIQKIDNMDFIVLEENLPTEVYEFKINEETNNKILFLLGLRTNNVDKKKYNCMFAYTKGFPASEGNITFTRFDEIGSIFYDCSSFLKEKNKEYPVTNLSNLCSDTPWVESVPGYGIDEGFSVKRDNQKYLLLINGYISYDKPYLYKQNGRIKKLKVKGIKSGKEIIVDVLDTPHPQTVDISELADAEDIRVTIEDVYPGTKYEDTCLHYLLVWNEEVIPYKNDTN